MAVRKVGVPPSVQRVRAQLKDLRTLIDTTSDPCERRIAYGMETAIRWATEHTVDWPGMAVEAKELAKMLTDELKSP